MKTIRLLALTSLFIAPFSLAHNVQLNQPLPSVSVAQDGELRVNNHKIAYQTWSSSTLTGKVRVVQHIAGRSGVKAKNEPLMDAIRQAHFDRTRYQTTTIINADDAIIATGSFVKSSAEEGKLNNPHSQVVLDQQSSVKNAWGLQPKESFIAVLDKQGKVQFVSEGKLSPTQIQQVIDLVSNLLKE